MSNRYSLIFNLGTTDDYAALEAVTDVARMVDGTCLVERALHTRLSEFVFEGRVTFLAAGNGEAADLARRTETLPGLPPMDAVAWRLVKADV